MRRVQQADKHGISHTRCLVRRMVMQMETKSDHGVFVVVTAIPRFVWLASVALTEGGAGDIRAGGGSVIRKALGRSGIGISDE